MRLIRVAALAATAVLLTGCASGTAGASGNADVAVNGDRGWHGTTVSKGYPLPDQTFTDTEGATVTPADAIPTARRPSASTAAAERGVTVNPNPAPKRTTPTISVVIGVAGVSVAIKARPAAPASSPINPRETTPM